MNNTSNYYLADTSGAHWAWRTVGGKRTLRRGSWWIEGIEGNPNYWLGPLEVESEKMLPESAFDKEPKPVRTDVRTFQTSEQTFDVWTLKVGNKS